MSETKSQHPSVLEIEAADASPLVAIFLPTRNPEMKYKNRPKLSVTSHFNNSCCLIQTFV
jgi:hypothetical protein